MRANTARRFLPVFAVMSFLLLVGCGSDEPAVTGSDIADPTPQSTTPDQPGETEADEGDTDDDGSDSIDDDVPGQEASGSVVMAVALEHLVRNDHTFGKGPPPFSEYLLLSAIDPGAGDAFGGGGPSRELTDEEKAPILAALESFGPVRYIESAEQFRNADLTPVIAGSVILGVGEPTIAGDSATVGVSLWCGGNCGTWMTYRLDRDEDGWAVTGTEGPIAIA